MSVADAVTRFVGVATRRRRLERLCSELGWHIGGHEKGRSRLDLEIGGEDRPMFIAVGDEGFVGFETFSRCDASQVPEELYSYPLLRNALTGFGGWSLENGRFSLTYVALGDALTVLFKAICQNMLDEAVRFDAKMEKEGYL